ncbi:MAG: HlyC/CorC family transporter [Anaerolineae bacterium]|nr:HlyC/CorC family transporter [Anaerolineae bacterium]
MDILLKLLGVALLVSANGFFVAAEFSLVGVRKTRIQQLASEGNAAAKVTQKALEHLDSYIAATQLGITLASLALGWIGEPAIAPLFEGVLHLLPFPKESFETVSASISIAASFSVVTLLHIVFGELAPKSIALQRTESTALLVARPTTWFLRIFRPVIWLMNALGNGIVRLIGIEPVSGHVSVLSTEELEMLVHSSREAGVLMESEEQMLRRVFDFADVQVREIMRPRTEVDAIPINTNLHELLKITVDFQHTRYPIYEGSIDKIVGILHTKDVLDKLALNPRLLTDQADQFSLSSILRTPLFVPQTVSVADLLERMQRSRAQFAIIIDEYGGMAGVATMEDLIEEIVGEVQDEFDTEPSLIQSHGKDIEVDGLVSLTEIAERFGEVTGEYQSTTIGGYVAERLDKIPGVGDVTTYGDYDLTVVEMDGRRASKIRFKHRDTVQESAAS